MAGAALTIVIPAFNEAHRLGGTLARLRDYALRADWTCEVIVVDDGSADGTADVARRVEPGPLVLRVLDHQGNRGKGYSVRQGMLAASGELLLMCDADLSVPIGDLDKLLPWVQRGCDVVIGSRDLPDSKLDPPQPALRRFMALVFRTIRRGLLLPELRDTQCGFKLFTRAAARDVFRRATVDGWLFDCEALAIAARLGYRIREVGVTWQHHADSRVCLLREVFTAVPTLLAIRRRVQRLPVLVGCQHE